MYALKKFSYGGQPPIQHRNPPALSIQNSPIHSERTSVHNHRIHEELQINTVLSEMKKWNTEHLSKLESHTTENIYRRNCTRQM
jgi:hypothetical protein